MWSGKYCPFYFLSRFRCCSVIVEETVEQLDLSHEDVTFIAELIDDLIVKLVQVGTLHLEVRQGNQIVLMNQGNFLKLWSAGSMCSQMWTL